MKKPQFTEGTIYHIYNRGVDKRIVFLRNQDRIRFIHDLYEFNDADPASNLWYYCKESEVQPRYIPRERKQRKLLVEILAFVLMPNHYHLIVRQLRKNGITNFMQKLGTGYTMYFNKINRRVGALFQGRFKAVLVENTPHFIHLPLYVHANPLKLYRGATSLDKIMKFLESYRWSSFPDYIGKKNFPSVISSRFLRECFGGDREQYYAMRVFIKTKMEDLENIKEVMLDDDFEKE